MFLITWRDRLTKLEKRREKKKWLRGGCYGNIIHRKNVPVWSVLPSKLLIVWFDFFLCTSFLLFSFRRFQKRYRSLNLIKDKFAKRITNFEEEIDFFRTGNLRNEVFHLILPTYHLLINIPLDLTSSSNEIDDFKSFKVFGDEWLNLLHS